MRSSWVLVAYSIFFSLVCCWLPHEREIQNSRGRNLFQTRYIEDDVDGDHTKRWLPGKTPIRGVNLGSQFVIEPWMASNEWSNMGCGPANSESDCVSLLGQKDANTTFAKHWASWINQADIQRMATYSLNTIRIPLGYWIFEDIKYGSEHFPEGGLAYLSNIVSWAADEGFYIILDLHGAPSAQVSQQPFTGLYIDSINQSSPAFYQKSQYERGYWFLGNLTHLIHTDSRYKTVGMLEIVNEPISLNGLSNTMRKEYYPKAYAAIRKVEKSLGVTSNTSLHVQMMDDAWGSGDPTQYLSKSHSIAYDHHKYIGFSLIDATQDSYLSAACTEVGGNGTLIVGEWSLHVTDENQWDPQFWPISNNTEFYQQFFVKQARTYEKQYGWIFWSWKTNIANPRWDYSAAVDANIIPKNLDSMKAEPC